MMIESGYVKSQHTGKLRQYRNMYDTRHVLIQTCVWQTENCHEPDIALLILVLASTKGV